jgi:hypothetical protein
MFPILQLHYLRNAALEAARRVAESAQIDHACRKVLSEILDNVCGKSSDDKEDLTELTRKRKKQHLRVSAPKRMANPFRYNAGRNSHSMSCVIL